MMLTKQHHVINIDFESCFFIISIIIQQGCIGYKSEDLYAVTKFIF